MKKLGSQLTTGDVVVTSDRIVLIRPEGFGPSDTAWICVDIARASRTETRYFKPDVEYEVAERPGTLHGNELAHLLGAARQLLDMPDRVISEVQRATLAGILDRLLPPNPPTLMETLQAFAAMVERGQASPDDVQLVDRARRAGLLNGDA